MSQWAWSSEAGVRLVEASSEDEAYEKVIAFRMTSGQTREEAEGWFSKDDRLEPVVGSIS